MKTLSLANLEFRAMLRSPAGLASVALCAALGLVLGGAEGVSPSLIGYRVARCSALVLGFLCLPLLAGAARRDVSTRSCDTVQSRPELAERLLLARWLGNLFFLLLLLLLVAVLAFGAEGLGGGPLQAGEGSRLSIRAFVDALVLGALPLLFLSVLGYCAAELLQNVLAAAIIAMYWVLVLLGRDYLARIFDFSLGQNAPVYLLLSAGTLLAAMAVARARQRLEGPPPRPRAPGCRPGLATYSALCLAGGVLLACHLVLTRHDPPLHPHPVTQTIAGQSIRCGRLPGFWLPDQFGQRVRLAEFEGKRLVVGFWSPAEPDSVGLLAALQQIHEKYESAGDVRVVAVCLSDDTGIARRFALERGYRFPMVTDTGTHWATRVVDSSPLAEAYEVDALPQVFVADHNRDLVAGSGLMPPGQLGAFIEHNLAVAARRP